MNLPEITIHIVPLDSLEPGQIVHLRATWVHKQQAYQFRSALPLEDVPEVLPIAVGQLVRDALEKMKQVEALAKVNPL